MNQGQHGFRRGRSCLSQLLQQYDNLLQELARGNNVDTVFLDFAKAFDKVDHGVLLHKLRNLGITGKIGAWIHSFLTDRSQIVVVNGKHSLPSKVVSDIHQGLVLGPLLFIILMVDIDKGVRHLVISSFADDTNINKTVSTVGDVDQLQQNLNKIYTWAKNNNMSFNNNKFELLRCGKEKDIKHHISLHTTTNPIETSSHVKCLGIQLSEDDTFHHHIHQTAKKARRLARWILKTFHTREASCLLTLWKALVQPVLDYCSQLWSPHKAADVQAVEAVQRSFTALIWEAKGLNYWDRLQKLGHRLWLGFYSQQRRRERYRIIYTWKILEGLVPNPSPNSKIVAKLCPRVGRMCCQSTLPSQASGRMKTLLAASLTYKGHHLFNSLPRQVRNTTNCKVEHFKNQLDKFLKSVPDKPPVPGYTSLCRAASNTIPDQICLQKRDTGHESSGGSPWL